jgi:cytochrome c peroxidase
MKLLPKALLTTMFSLAAAGCGDAPSQEQQEQTAVPMTGGTGFAHQALTQLEEDGKGTFENQKFKGNDRTCVTCHTAGTGTLTPAQAQALWNSNPGAPLFRAIDSDDGTGASYNRLRTHATVNVEINLPANIQLVGSSARKVTLRRSIPTTIDAPKLDTMLMFDGRAQDLQQQAAGAISGHAQAGRQPTQYELDSIAAYEKTLFSSSAMRAYALSGGPMPGIPAGNTDSEKRGRAWFEPTALCGSCHNGALLNVMTAGNPMGLPAGTQFGTALVAERNKLNNPMLEFDVTKADGTVQRVASPDPGLMLVTGDPGTANLFKMTSLRNLKNTPPYFSDGSAKTIEDIVDQYNFLMDTLGIPHTEQDLVDITAYLKLL